MATRLPNARRDPCRGATGHNRRDWTVRRGRCGQERETFPPLRSVSRGVEQRRVGRLKAREAGQEGLAFRNVSFVPCMRINTQRLSAVSVRCPAITNPPQLLLYANEPLLSSPLSNKQNVPSTAPFLSTLVSTSLNGFFIWSLLIRGGTGSHRGQ